MSSTVTLLKANTADAKEKRQAGLAEREAMLHLYNVPNPELPAQVDERDMSCPDSWLPRRPELLRLTGLHPFNCEPPLPILMDKGFLTPPSLHYVRNHGPVPKLDWNTHKIELKGLNGRTVTISMDELASLPLRTLPVTLTCAGNRRKELNMLKKSIGFSWGCGAVSTSVWTGVRLVDVLQHFGFLDDVEEVAKTKFICYEGVDELPKGNKRYGTSLAIETALDPSRDVMLAFEQNGERLTPDHGYPVRMLIPGFIGGRMVKWLGKIWLSEVESDNHYHFFDNRVLPPQITEEKANDGGWWYKPEFIINDRNINSAISSPGHNEVLELGTAGNTYILKGYAYNGGGRRITRVEYSLDYGKSWHLTKLTQPERPTPYGRYWCWSFWEAEIDSTLLLETKEISCRAWDESTNTQPGNYTWNVMGMMNNPWFRVKIYPTRTEKGGLALTFKHPATIQDNGGWLSDEKEPVKVAPKQKVNKNLPKYTKEEVSKHTTKEDCWIILADHIYHVTPEWLAEHPGGESSILSNAGKDATKFFDVIHSQPARDMLDKYLIGVVSGDSAKL